ncbi:MAG: methyltransferase domain-containing protein [bacterium]|nr:methyltransferase domain-containing protein [bacterium]
MLPDLSERFDGLERMDRSDCDEAHLYRTLAQFRYVNLVVSRYRYCLKRWIVADMLRDRSSRYHLVDLGAGGCDIPAWLLRHCQRRSLKLRVTAVDSNARTVAWARERYGDIPDLNIVCGSAFEIGDLGDVDYVYANHFLHHLPRIEIVRLLHVIQAVVRRKFLVCDLVRSRFSYVGFSLLAGPLLRDSFAFEDGQISIRRGFTLGEFQHLIDDSDIRGRCQIFQMFPGRLAMVGGSVLGDLPADPN